MKIHSLIAGSILVAMLASCSASLKTAQTVDDVYFSPGREVGADVKENSVAQNDYSYNKEDDNYLRMVVQNRSRWSSIDDYAYWNSYNTTSYGLGLGYSNFYNNYWNNSYYNYNPYSSFGYGYGYNNYYPYYGYGNGFNNYYPSYGYNYGHNYYNPGVYIKNVSSNSGPRANLGAYQNHTFSNQNYSNSNNANHFTNGNTPQTGVGRLLRTIVTGGSNGNTNSNYNPARTFSNSNSPSTNTYTPSSSSSSSAPAAASSRTSSAGSSSSSGGATRRN